MPARCCVRGCTSSGIRMHTFPTDLKNRMIWMELLDREDLLKLDYERVKQSYRVCTLHFTDDYKYRANSSRINLKKTARPTLYLPSKDERESDELVNFNNVCRACLSTDQKMIDLDHTVFENLKVFDVYNQYLLIKIKKGDNLPQQICTSCLYELCRVYLFINNSREADVKLRELIESTEEEEFYNNPISHHKAPTSEELMVDMSNFKEDFNEMEYIIFTGENNTAADVDEDEVSKYYELGPIKVPEPGPPFICNNCSEEFETLESLKIHRTKMKHYVVQQYKCRYCVPSKVYTFRHWKSHMRVHTGEKPFECYVCGKKFSARTNMERHIVTHTGEKPYKCEVCDKGFTQSTSLKTHLFRIHNYIKQGESNRVIQCTICNELFDSKPKLDSHTLDHYGSKYVCGTCGKCFNFKSLLEKHMDKHKKPADQACRCELCNKVFAKPAFLRFHMRTHSGVKPFRCEQCGKCFSQKSHMITHQVVHTGEKPFGCEFCGKRFAVKGNLTVHVRQHTGENPYTCDSCGKGFIDTSRLKYHKRNCGSDMLVEAATGEDKGIFGDEEEYEEVEAEGDVLLELLDTE